MELKFQTKEESNREQREAFLRLLPKERFYRFLDLCESLKKFPVKTTNNAPTDNFVIEIKTHGKDSRCSAFAMPNPDKQGLQPCCRI
jgi:hypothetical protein